MDQVPYGGGVALSQFYAGSNAAIAGIYERNQEATLYVANLDAKVDEEILWELFIQCAPLASVNMPRERISSTHQGFAFVEFTNPQDADYALRVMNMVKLYGKPIRINKGSSGEKRGAQTSEVGANLFIGGLTPQVDERLLQETFGQFGVVSFCKIMRNQDTGESKGFAFISFDSFASSDAAMAAMNGQFLGGRPISVSYSVKKDAKTTRHGSAPERLIASLGKT